MATEYLLIAPPMALLSTSLMASLMASLMTSLMTSF